jgi:hypothetical protein
MQMGWFGKRKKEEPERASITDFSPVEHIAFRASKPVYTNINYEIRYSPDGLFKTTEPVIWRDEPDYWKGIRGVDVSPDATHLVIHQRKQLFVLTQSGKLLDTIREVDSGGARKYDASSVQWAIDSSCFYLLFYEKYSSNFNKRSKNKSILFRYRIAERKLEAFIYFNSDVSCFDYILSRDNGSIYFKPHFSRYFYQLPIREGSPFHVKVHSVSGNEKTSYAVYTLSFNEQPLTPIRRIEDEFKNLFVNFSAHDFEQGSTQAESADLKTIIYCNSQGLYVSKEYRVSKVFSIRVNEAEHNSKEGPDIGLWGAYFLPGDQYFIFKPYAKEYQGYLVLDVATNQYARLPYHKLDSYFSVTSRDCPLLRFDYRIEPAWDDSRRRGYRQEVVNGQYMRIELPLLQPNLRDALKACKANDASGKG